MSGISNLIDTLPIKKSHKARKARNLLLNIINQNKTSSNSNKKKNSERLIGGPKPKTNYYNIEINQDFSKINKYEKSNQIGIDELPINQKGNGLTANGGTTTFLAGLYGNTGIIDASSSSIDIPYLSV